LDKLEEEVESSVNLKIELKPVPKMLGMIKSTWNKKTVLVSFKLETDQSILAKKASYSIKKYCCDLVIANLLQTCRTECQVHSVVGEPHHLSATEKHLEFHIAEYLLNII